MVSWAQVAAPRSRLKQWHCSGLREDFVGNQQVWPPNTEVSYRFSRPPTLGLQTFRWRAQSTRFPPLKSWTWKEWNTATHPAVTRLLPGRAILPCSYQLKDHHDANHCGSVTAVKLGSLCLCAKAWCESFRFVVWIRIHTLWKNTSCNH